MGRRGFLSALEFSRLGQRAYLASCPYQPLFLIKTILQSRSRKTTADKVLRAAIEAKKLVIIITRKGANMWDLRKTVGHARSVIRRREQGKPPYSRSPEEDAYFKARQSLNEQGCSMAEINAQTIELRDAAYPLGDWPGSGSGDS